MKYRGLIQKKFSGDLALIEDYSKYDFLENFFGFVTYDGGEGSAQEYLCNAMIGAIKAILNKETFEYQENNYIEYITMVNMPFLRDKLSWGTSIRGAWFDCSEWGGKTYDVILSLEDNVVKIGEKDFIEFMRDLLYWFEN